MSLDDQSLGDLLSKLQESAGTSRAALPSPPDVYAPEHGISLLDAKSDIFLDYLQTLVFLILVKLREHQSGTTSPVSSSLDQKAVKKLVELRVYLDRGVRPLENRLKYQIEKVLRVADAPPQSTSATEERRKRPAGPIDDDSDESGSEQAKSEHAKQQSVEELAYRPSLAAFAPKASTKTKLRQSKTEQTGPADQKYRPPRITPTALLTTDGAEKSSRKPSKTVRSAAVDDYIANELSTAPTAEPSIGSTITAGGRSTKTAREKAREDERRDYEESNFMRLPRESGKERARERARASQRGGQMGEFDLSGLGAMSDRVARATAKRSGGKRGRDVSDGPRGGGFDSGYKESKRKKN